jgi:hypothetical protein
MSQETVPDPSLSLLIDGLPQILRRLLDFLAAVTRIDPMRRRNRFAVAGFGPACVRVQNQLAARA